MNPWEVYEAELQRQRGIVATVRRQQIVRTVIATHGWNVL